VLAHGISGPQVSRYIFLFLGLFVVALVFRFPLATALVFIGLTDFIVYPTMFAHNVGSLSVRPHEVALACLLLLAVVRPKRKTWGGVPGTALAVFLALLALSAAIAVQSGDTSLSDAFNWGRPMGLLTFFYVIVRLFPSPEDRRLLLTGTVVLAALTGVVAVPIALGSGIGSSLEPPGDLAIRTQEGLGNVERVRLAGLSAGYALFWFTVVQISALKGRPSQIPWLLMLAGIGADIAVSFNRNMWLGLVIGAILMAILGGALVRNRMAVGAAVAVGGLAVLMVFGSSATSDRVVQPIIQRGATILNPGKTAKENSLQDRAKETSEAWATAQNHLLLGVGPGVPFGVNLQETVSSGSLFLGYQVVPQLFLHNQYIYLILISGIPGLIAFLLFLGAPVVYSVRRLPSDPAIVSCGVGILLIMISAAVAIYFTVEDMTAVLGLLTGVIVADREGRATAREGSGLLR
jgi:O-antigen ligase